MFPPLWCFVISMIAFTVTSAEEFRITDKVYLDIFRDKQELGRVIIGLFGEKAPRTVKNFKTIASKGLRGKTYAGTRIHRVIKRFIIQGGDVIANNGSGSMSIYGKYFDDENLDIAHRGPGFVGMANTGRNTNGCQFYITTSAAPWLDGDHVVFGKVLTGQRVVHTIENFPTDYKDEPINDIIIKSCGLIPVDNSFVISDEAYDIWAWISASTVPLTLSFSILGVFQWLLSKLN